MSSEQKASNQNNNIEYWVLCLGFTEIFGAVILWSFNRLCTEEWILEDDGEILNSKGKGKGKGNKSLTDQGAQ